MNKALIEHRKAKDDFFATSFQAPLDHGDRHGFSGLPYFEPNESLVFTVQPEPADGKEIRVDTSDGQERIYQRDSTVSFDVDGKPVTLVLYTTGHAGYFLPFRDSTSGKTTYGAGRYIDLEPNSDGSVTIDFNMAYNPYCAYNDGYSCPLPPVENWLQIPIEAGELDWVRPT